MAIAPHGEKILVHTSNFRKVKRVEDVIYTFQMVQEKIPAKLLLVGDGPERHRCEELCRQLGLFADVRFLGKQNAVEELLAVSDLFIMPSEMESFGLAALEAMACQLPVISSNTGGLPELNIHGVTGYTTDVGNVRQMAEYAIELLSNEERYKQFRANALARASEFDIDKILPQYENYYREVIEKSLYPK